MGWNGCTQVHIWTTVHIYRQNVYTDETLCYNRIEISTSTSKQNGHQFADNFFKCIFMNKSLNIWIKFYWNMLVRVKLTKLLKLLKLLITNEFFILIQIWWQFYFALIQILTQRMVQNFTHGTTAMLSLNQSDLGGQKMESQQNKFTDVFELWSKNHLWNEPQIW